LSIQTKRWTSKHRSKDTGKQNIDIVLKEYKDMIQRQYKHIPVKQFHDMADNMGVDVDVLEANLRVFDVLVDRREGRMRSSYMVERRERMTQALY
jgi:hypothetical protein